ncbi:hypothetical protein Pint_27013 [Pistacia integerrima]|uniref:Uncharacterized protein n=1 Tax=Pistacia integerrima TaxID=434235 RepID=A0ACC0YP72_9ROSI|nr:hypothetical protein Pint_27013 [Pistacia integerrima]
MDPKLPEIFSSSVQDTKADNGSNFKLDHFLQENNYQSCKERKKTVEALELETRRLFLKWQKLYTALFRMLKRKLVAALYQVTCCKTSKKTAMGAL